MQYRFSKFAKISPIVLSVILGIGTVIAACLIVPLASRYEEHHEFEIVIRLLCPLIIFTVIFIIDQIVDLLFVKVKKLRDVSMGSMVGELVCIAWGFTEYLGIVYAVKQVPYSPWIPLGLIIAEAVFLIVQFIAKFIRSWTYRIVPDAPGMELRDIARNENE